MKTADANTIAAAALKDLAEALERGMSDTLVRYLAAQARFHRYSFGNVLMILAQRPDATRVAGFHTWRTFGRTVKRGEKGIAIFAPMRVKRRAETDDDERAGETTLRFRVVHVFDVAQTEGEPLPEPAQVGGDPGRCLDRLRTHIASLGIAIDDDVPAGAEGCSRGGRIGLKPGLPPAQEFSVACHELAHELLHHTGERPSKTVRETEAEAVAFIVCESIGLATSTASSDYIRLYAGSAETLAASLERIQRTAASIIAAVNAEAGAANDHADRGRCCVDSASVAG